MTHGVHFVTRSLFVISLILGGRCLHRYPRSASSICPRSWESGGWRSREKGTSLEPGVGSVRLGGNLGGYGGAPSLYCCNSLFVCGVCTFTFEGSLALRLNCTGKIRCWLERWAHGAWPYGTMCILSPCR